jgi:hypothetical protein
MSFVDGIPKVLMAIVILIIGSIISKIIRNMIKKVLVKINIDKIGEKLNEIEFVEKSNIKIKFSTVISKIVYYILMLLFFTIAAEILAMPAVSNLVSDMIKLVPNLIVAGIILVIGTIFADMLKTVAQTTLDSLGIPSARLLASLLFYFLLINIVLTALTQAQIKTEFLSQNISLVIGGIILAFAIGYGLASVGSMSNFLASYYSRGKFDVGDTITVEDVTGKIVEIDKSSLILIAENGNKVILPLSQVTKSKIEIHN